MSVALLYTGGTIGGRPAKGGRCTAVHGLAGFMDLLRSRLPAGYWPAGLTAEGVLGRLSENLAPADWSALARAADARIRAGARGVVIAHGTDTLVYSACALAELLRGVPVPVVLTGARVPLAAPDTDAAQNLAHAFRLAGARSRMGVWISFAGTPVGPSVVLAPENARKEAWRPDCFAPVRGAPAGRIVGAVARGEALRLLWRRGGPPARSPHAYAPRFAVDARAVLFKLHPGFDPDWIRLAAARDVRAIVLEAYGTGTACTEAGAFDVAAAVRAAVEQGVRVRVVSQHGGDVRPAYGSTAALMRAGARLWPGLTAEAALTRLMCRLDAGPPVGV